MNVAVLLSGGVDSAVALRLALDAGHDVHAFYLKIWLEDELAALGTCPWEDDLRHAHAVCEQVGVGLEIVSLQREYHAIVVAEALRELAAGRTPSPDILCNQRIKFGAFFDALGAHGPFDRVVSGHYARLALADPEHPAHATRLLRGVDPVKDQTYFLYQLDQQQLTRCLFPIGGYRKDEVRSLARRYGLPNRDRPDSQGICFLGKVPFDAFVRSYLGDRPGEIREHGTERVLGEHRGLWFHTMGQRRGLGLGGGPWYVVGKDTATNVLTVAHGDGLANHHCGQFSIPAPHWIAGTAPSSLEDDLRLTTKIRHGSTVIPCTITARASGGLVVALDRPDPGIAEGQSAVLYDGDECLGGGVIAAAEPHGPETSTR